MLDDESRTNEKGHLPWSSFHVWMTIQEQQGKETEQGECELGELGGVETAATETRRDDEQRGRGSRVARWRPERDPAGRDPEWGEDWVNTPQGRVFDSSREPRT
jgi:hypothetical protein